MSDNSNLKPPKWEAPEISACKFDEMADADAEYSNVDDRKGIGCLPTATPCNPNCAPACQPSQCNPSCSPRCRPACNPTTCYPICRPRFCQPRYCFPACRPACNPSTCYPNTTCPPYCSPRNCYPNNCNPSCRPNQCSPIFPRP
ncbi:hypothetical protein [Dendrosporobacter sp. 1207_IL3150]|uniref:hypothetical protein n=1 Tax=Dendrosporobacter sp. 1207_IL3150 TaxID=3084054 RepID=UPI002FD96C8E